MDLNHLHLHAKSIAKTRKFYETYFGFRELTWHGGILFLRNRDGFDLAIAPSRKREPLPAWFHFGFRLPDAASVRRLHRKLGRRAAPLGEEPGFVWFRCSDPDGHSIEVYWE